MGVKSGTASLALGLIAVSAVVAGQPVGPALARTSANTAPGALVRASTVMYWGNTRIGTVDPGEYSNPRDLAISCDAYSGGGVETNRQGTSLVAFSEMNYNFGFGRLLRPGRWSFRSAKGRLLVGYAQRRTPLRWDVLKGTHRVGHTVGPDGPQAAAALLLVCT